jgi:hypothetical protein
VKRLAFIGGLALALGPPLVTASEAAPAPRVAIAGTLEAPIRAISGGGAILRVTAVNAAGFVDLTTPNLTEQAKLAPARAGDTVKLDVDDVSNPAVVIKVERVTRPVSAIKVVLVLIVAAALLAVLGVMVTRKALPRFLIGIDNRYSNSQVQFALWFGMVATVYSAAIFLRATCLNLDYFGQINVTGNAMALTGLSALSFGGAKAITSMKVSDAVRAGQPTKTTAARPNLIDDLIFNDNGRPDLGDFQMMLVTLAAMVIFLVAAFRYLTALPIENPTTLPDIDTAVLSGFGIGQGAYLLKKVASPLGSG